MQSTRLLLARALAACVAWYSLGAAAEPPQRLPLNAKPHVNAAGQPVLDSQRQRINYRREEWRAPPAPAAAPAAARPGAAGVPISGVGQLADWGWAALGSGIGLSGMVTAQVDRETELYAGGSFTTFGGNGYWFSLRWNRAAGRFDVNFVSDQHSAGIRRIVTTRSAGAFSKRDARDRIVVGYSDGTLRSHARRTKALLSTTIGPCATRGGLQALAAADLNGDGGDELLSVCGDGTLFVEDELGGGWSLPGIGGTEIVVGQMDNDPAREIATTSGRVIDSATRSVQWTHTQAFGAHLQVADIDGDGRDELLASESWNWVWAFDVERQLPKWSLRASTHDIGAILMADIDGDGVKDLLVGEGQWGRVWAYDPVTLQPKGSVDNPEHGVAQIAVADLDGDGRPELMWSAGATSSGEDHLYVADWTTKAIRWQNDDLVGPFLGPMVGDLDGDGIPEIVVVSSWSDATYASGRILVFDSRTLALRAVSPGVAGGTFAWTGVKDLKLRDMDGDGRQEIIIAADWLYDGLIEIYRYDGASTFQRVWTNTTRPSGAPFHSVEVADVDGDGHLDILAGVGYAHSGQQGSFVYAYDGRTGAEKWRTQQHLGGTISSLVLGDFDGNGVLDFAAGVLGGPVYVFNMPTHGLDAIVTLQSTALALMPTAPIPRLIVGQNNGWASVRAFDGGFNYPEIQAVSLGTAAVTGITVSPAGHWWVGMSGRLRRFEGGRSTFNSANYGTGLGRNAAWVAGSPSAVFSTGGYGLHRFNAVP